MAPLRTSCERVSLRLTVEDSRRLRRLAGLLAQGSITALVRRWVRETWARVEEAARREAEPDGRAGE